MPSHPSPIRRARGLALLIAVGVATGGVACAETSTAPPPPLSAVGTYALHAAGGNAPPALVHQSVEAETGRTLDVYVTSDTLTLTADGRYVQRARLEVRSGAQVVGRSAWNDHGTVARAGDVLHFESDYVQNVAFDGTVNADGAIHLVQDLPREGTTAPYRFHRAP